MSSPKPDEILDLYSIALLSNYEQASSEPRFRSAKLMELASQTDQLFPRCLPEFKALGWGLNKKNQGFLFTVPSTSTDASPTPDKPSNMLVPEQTHPSLSHLTAHELETIFHQVRSHDGCYKTIRLLQYFFSRYPAEQKLRVRTTTGDEFLTAVSERVIMEWEFIAPAQITLSTVVEDSNPTPTTHVTGQGEKMLHATLGFAASTDENVRTVLDLASMQFGELGRGLKSNGMFVLESLDQYYDRIEKVAVGTDNSTMKLSKMIAETPDDVWLEEVAERVRMRWDKREEEPWCAHCGAPDEGGKKLKKCSLCQVFYCNAEHQKENWPCHKSVCTGKKGKKA
ncbi:hypothetical protein BP5796_01066 [Coleophoma crateriformis]|uniref:MYND-type domain-containing protein n=1 Tax=Coleophoma crateriformis TaxID=565419 RepID=A0A3D8T9S0_9HELO|nr:hypothetical protein BP5796_01066 [Coleophoma crateriformis]